MSLVSRITHLIESYKTLAAEATRRSHHPHKTDWLSAEYYVAQNIAEAAKYQQYIEDLVELLKNYNP